MSTRSAFITGAATGIGRGLSHKLASEGWRVFAGVLPGQDTRELMAYSLQALTPVEIDVTDNYRIKKAVETIGSAAGDSGLNLLVNCAAIGGKDFLPLEYMDEKAFKDFLEINLWGQVRVTRGRVRKCSGGCSGERKADLTGSSLLSFY